jgi:hypothetical protein
MNLRIYLALLAAGLALLAGCGEQEPPTEARVTIGEHTWTVELAMDRQTRTKGLSGRTDLPADRGMLFVYPQPKIMSFWMEGCLIPIDIVFLDADRRVLNTYEMTVEPDGRGRARYSSHVPAQYALELPAGSIRRAGIAVGDSVEFIGVPPASSAESD